MALTKEELRKLVITHLQQMGYDIRPDGTLVFPGTNKDGLRQLHAAARDLEVAARQDWLQHRLPHLLHFFADGSEVIPAQVSPVLCEVTTPKQHELFRVARLLWSLPFSPGFGRRLRFLVMDASNEKLIGILALQSPPLSFPARDRLFEYPEGEKPELVNQTMDIQTLGSVPPYTRLLGGKLVALAAASNEVRAAYHCKYNTQKTEMTGRVLPPHLVALTTTSAFGRSSLYNRLRYQDILIAESLGYTIGYGSFHLLELYPLFREYLEERGISTRGGYGTGPRRKWQTIIRALDQLGLPRRLLKHGIKREAFLFPLIDNLKDYMEGGTTIPLYRDLPFSDLANFWRSRWLLDRASRVDGWHEWQRDEIKSLLMTPQRKDLGEANNGR